MIEDEPNKKLTMKSLQLSKDGEKYFSENSIW